jgi:hypothetical protein
MRACLPGSEARAPPGSLSSTGRPERWIYMERGGIRPAARGVGIYGGGRWWVAPESADGLRAKAWVQSRRNAGRTATRAEISAPISRSPAAPARAFFYWPTSFFAVTATSPHPPTTATGGIAIDRSTHGLCHPARPPGRPAGRPLSDRLIYHHLRSFSQNVRGGFTRSSAPSLCSEGLPASHAWPFQTCNAKRVAAKPASRKDGRCQTESEHAQGRRLQLALPPPFS